MANLPKHIVVIPDGNRRWARSQGLMAFLGHEAGAKRLEEILEAALELKIPYFTFWGMSLDNVTKRSKEEVAFLFGLFEKYFNKLLENKEVDENKVKVTVLGRWREHFPERLKNVIEEILEKTRDYDQYHLTFLMAYSGVDEMTEAIAMIANSKLQNPDLKINQEIIKNNLWTYKLPPVDLVIRTGGEPHWSAGLMMWDVSDAQLYFTETLWPDFSSEEFKKALEKYSKIERRFGQ